MTDAQKQVHQSRDSDREGALVKEAAPALRGAPRPYTAPRLRYLGSVRDLTLGSVGPILDADCTGAGVDQIPDNC
jgi:hypothetical protein